MIRRLVVGTALTLGVVLVPALAASAHPLGNFTINHFSGLEINGSSLTIDVVTDMAEIPAYQVRGDIDTNHDGTVDPAEADRWRAHACADQAGRLSVEVDGRAVPLVASAVGSLSFPPGQAGLDTLRLECQVHADLHADSAVQHSLVFIDHNFEGRIGWREVVATAAGGDRLLSSDVPSTSVSSRLTSYPKDLLRSPLNQQHASVRVEIPPAGNPAAIAAPPRATPPSAVGPTSILPRGIDRATRAFTSLVAHRHLSVAFGALAVAVALVLGAFHALAPGHGKTVMAAYLVGQRGSLRQAALIGLTVTATHTVGVLGLGIVLTTSTIIAPERLYPWLGLASGLLVAGIGVGMLVRARRMRLLVAAPIASPDIDEHQGDHHDGHVHAHDRDDHHHVHDDDGDDHDGHDHGHRHGDDHQSDHQHHDHQAHDHGGRVHTHVVPDPNRPVSWKALVAMGFAGGLVPSPSALVVLLGAIALGRAWFGLLLVVAYGLGMAGMLTGAGLLLVRVRRLLERRAQQRPGRLVKVAYLLPTATAIVIVIVGVLLASRGAAKI